MASVVDVCAPYANFMIAPRPGHGVCGTCFNLTDGYDRCFACSHGGDSIELVDPISYSIAGEQLHHALAAYKRCAAPWARRLADELAAVLWRHLALHEDCLARQLGVSRFPVVTTVPSGRATRGDRAGRGVAAPHPLHTIVADIVGPTRERHRTLLRRTDAPVAPHAFSPDRFAVTRPLAGEPVLLIDDTWTTGASAQSAAATLKKAGSGPIAAVVIGRYLNRGWRDNDRRLNAREKVYDWSRCPYCGPPTPG